MFSVAIIKYPETNNRHVFKKTVPFKTFSGKTQYLFQRYFTNLTKTIKHIFYYLKRD